MSLISRMAMTIECLALGNNGPGAEIAPVRILTHSGSRYTAAERAGHLENGSDSSEDLIVCHCSHLGLRS